MSDADVIPLVDEGLGNTSYVVDLGDGRALAVDVSRDLRAVREVTGRRGLTVAFAADTHLHADFLTGAVDLAERDGAAVLASAAGGREYPHIGLADGDEIDLGGLTLRTLATPGHTHEHLAFQLLDGPRVLGVFTGGSLLVGSAARTDLAGSEQTEELARLQYRSLRRLAELDDGVAVWPTHGAGSFCSAPPGAERTSTIGRERAANHLLRAPDEDTFVSRLLESLGSFPPYFLRLAEVNRKGPAPAEGDDLRPLPPAEVTRLLASGAEMVDVRPVAAFAQGHIPGALSIALRPVFATWLGWLVERDTPVVIVRDPDQDPGEILWQARKVGHDLVAGELEGGMPAWSRAGGPVGSIPLVGPDGLDRLDRLDHLGGLSSPDGPGTAGAAHLLDVRQDAEFSAGHVPGAAHVELGELAGGAGEPPEGPTVVMCGHGERAMSAASLLARGGRRDIAVLKGGPQDLAGSGSGANSGAGSGVGGSGSGSGGARLRHGR